MNNMQNWDTVEMSFCADKKGFFVFVFKLIDIDVVLTQSNIISSNCIKLLTNLIQLFETILKSL